MGLSDPKNRLKGSGKFVRHIKIQVRAEETKLKRLQIMLSELKKEKGYMGLDWKGK